MKFLSLVLLACVSFGCASVKTTKAPQKISIQTIKVMDGYTLVVLEDFRILRLKDGLVLYIDSKHPNGELQIQKEGKDGRVELATNVPLNMVECTGPHGNIENCFISEAERLKRNELALKNVTNEKQLNEVMNKGK